MRHCGNRAVKAVLALRPATIAPVRPDVLYSFAGMLINSLWFEGDGDKRMRHHGAGAY